MQKCFVSLLCFFSPIIVFSQIFTSVSGFKVEVEQLSTDPDDGRNGSVFLGGFGPEGVYLLSAGYLLPKRAYLNLQGGPGSVHAGGSLLLFNTKKMKVSRQSLAGGGNVRYVGEITIPKRYSFGLHLGGNTVDQTELGNSNLLYQSVFGGFTFLKSSHVNYKIKGGNYKQRQGTSIIQYHLDWVYYFSDNEEEVFVQDQIQNRVREWGWRIYLDVRSTIWSPKGRFAIRYMLGFGQHADRLSRFSPLGGLGFGYSFG
ncbi:MAG: hypothetical protein ACFB10_25250 [Salibacteraceae bacterium]